MKTIYILVLALLLVACSTTYTFEQGFNKLKDLDLKYNADYKKESLNGTMADFYKINELVSELQAFHEKVSAMPFSNDTDALKTFTNARIAMLESERYFILGNSLGPAGLTIDTFTCKEIPQIEETTIYWNKSFHYGLNATYTLDDLLIKYPEYQPFVGINKEKTNFYGSPLGYLARESRRNKDSVQVYCNITIRGD